MDTVAGPGTNFSGVPFDTVYTTTAGIVEIDFTGQTGHTLLFTDPKLAGFELDTPNKQKGKVEMAAGYVHDLLQRHRPRGPGMQATIDVT